MKSSNRKDSVKPSPKPVTSLRNNEHQLKSLQQLMD